MKTSRLITGLVLALSLSMAPAIADEPTPVVATSEEVQLIVDATSEAVDAAKAAIDAAALAKDAADAATTAALDARDAADAANAALATLKAQLDEFAASTKASITKISTTMAKIAKKLKAK